MDLSWPLASSVDLITDLSVYDCSETDDRATGFLWCVGAFKSDEINTWNEDHQFCDDKGQIISFDEIVEEIKTQANQEETVLEECKILSAPKNIVIGGGPDNTFSTKLVAFDLIHECVTETC